MIAVAVAAMQGIDGLAWTPLYVRHASNKGALLVKLVEHGGFDNVGVCEAVAAASPPFSPQSTL